MAPTAGGPSMHLTLRRMLERQLQKTTAAGGQARHGLRRPCLRRRHRVPSRDLVDAQASGTQRLHEAVKVAAPSGRGTSRCKPFSGTRNRSSTALPGRTLIRVKPWAGSVSAEPVLQAARWCRRPPIGTLRRPRNLGSGCHFFPVSDDRPPAICRGAKLGTSGCAPRLPGLLVYCALSR